ncbi:hypothetical protein OROGR_015484 [Orobanche gracilis]
MASSDEEGEIVAECVTNYYFVDSNQNPISFSCLPFKWIDDEGERQDAKNLESSEHAFLRGEVEDGSRKIYMKIIAWKLVLSSVLPEIYVLPDAKYGRWIKLQRPRKSFEDTVRTVLISAHCLHFIKQNSEEESGEALWKHIGKTFRYLFLVSTSSSTIRSIFLLTNLTASSTYEVPPSEKDLVDHIQWMKEAALRDEDIAKAKILPTFLSETSGKRKTFYEENGTGKRAKLIIYEDDDDIDDSCDADEDELFDRVCALCDDGGDLLCCEGRCIRSFHPTIESGAGSFCESLSYSSEQVHAIQTFMSSLVSRQHVDISIIRSVSQSLFSQEIKFKLKNSRSKSKLEIHLHALLIYVLSVSKEKIKVLLRCNLQYVDAAQRHTTANAYQGRPEENISFQRDDAKNIPQRAWEKLLINRILIYCMDHKICRKILTPRRDHLLFPDVDGNKEQHPTVVLPDKSNVMSERSRVYGILTNEVKVKELSKGITGDFINNNERKHAGKFTKINLSSNMVFSESVSVSEWRNPNKPISMGRIKSSLKSGKSMSKSSMRGVPENAAVENVPIERAMTLRTPEMKKRIQRRKCTNASSTLSTVDRTITMGKVECLVQAIQAALKKLQDGGTIEDAKAVCEPAILFQLIKWKKKLAVYLAPFIHGMRYTSFGRHFTKVEKLNQEPYSTYVGHEQTIFLKQIVDFCCGSNDFSFLMKEELDRMGRKCSFKNYDLIQPKNDFNFEKRDWMSIDLEELPEGSNLIMGLNPPFGVQASRANQFIDKALKFMPKLLILIVPKETERLDRKKIPYDLIWEDDCIFSGKSFYLPGSVDVRDQQMEQWNLDPPPLYLWSRPDWTTSHKLVAEEHGHLLKDQEAEEYAGGINNLNAVSNYLMEENQECYADFSNVADGYSDIKYILEDIPEFDLGALAR